jgi:hypothetical protein
MERQEPTMKPKKRKRWTVHNFNTHYAIQEGDKEIAFVRSSKANAAKIAALPAILDALEHAIADLRQLSDPDLDEAHGEERPSILEAVAALKAAGVKVK